MPVLPSYRNQSINLQGKSNDWFLYEGNTGTKWVKVFKIFFAGNFHEATEIVKFVNLPYMRY